MLFDKVNITIRGASLKVDSGLIPYECVDNMIEFLIKAKEDMKVFYEEQRKAKIEAIKSQIEVLKKELEELKT